MKSLQLLMLLCLMLAMLLLASCDRYLEEFLVSGVVTENGTGLAEVSINFSGDITGSTVTDSQGQWNALLRGSVRITPEKDDYSFEPPYRDLVVIEEKTSVDFVASPLEEPAYTLNINIWGSGTVLPISGQTYPEDTAVQLTVEPEDNWEFSQWSGDDADYIDHIASNTYEITMTKNMEVIAEFELITDSPPGGIPVFWQRQAMGQQQTCGECIWYWPNNYNWSQSKVVGPCPCGEKEDALLEPSNWSIDDAPDSGTHRVTIAGGNTVLLDTSAVIHSIDNGGLLQTVIGRGLVMSGGGLQNSGTIELAINSQFDLNIGLENSGLIEVACGAGISLAGPMNNSGTIVMEGPQARGTTLLLKGDVHLIGEGTITLTEEFFVRIDSLSGDRLVNEDNTIHGSGLIGFNDLALTNRGQIAADLTGEVLAVRPGVSRGPSRNDGFMLASDGGILMLSGRKGGDLDNSAGTIRAEDGSHVELEGGITITGGLLESIDTGRFYTKLDAEAGLEDLTFIGRFDIGHGTTLNLGGTIDNQGLIDIPAQTGRSTFLLLLRDTVLAGDGNIRLGEEFFGRIDSQAGYLLTNEDNTIHGCGEIGWTDLTLLNLGRITADMEDKILTVRPGASVPSQNIGLMLAVEGGILRFSGQAGGELDNIDGVLRAEDGSHVMLAEQITITGGLLETTGTGRFYTHLNPEATLVDLTFKGNFDVGNGATISLSGTINNQGSINIPALGGQSAVLQLIEDTTLDGGGRILLGDQFFGRITGAEDLLVLNIINQTISGEGRLGYGKLVIINEGEIEATNKGRMMRIQPYEGEIFINLGIVRAEAGAIVFVEGDYNQESEGELQVKIGLVDDEPVNGQLRVSGSSELNGTLMVELTDGFMPAIGSVFKILDLDFDEVTGEFVSVELPPLDEGQWDESLLLTSGILQVIN